ncbi:MAG: AMP-binding protein [Pricia sp.]
MNPPETHTESTPYSKIHRNFKFNGLAFSRDELKEVAYSLIKEGEPFEKSIGDFMLDWLNDTPIIEVQTSGSTGKPKRIVLQKRHMVNSALATGEFFGLRPSYSALLCLSSDYIAGKMMLVRAMVLGLELDYVSPASEPLLDVSKTYDFCAMVPLQLENSLDALPRIKTLIVGGAPLSKKLKEKAMAQGQNTVIYETYGMTETITHIALKRIDGKKAQSRNFKTISGATLSTDERGCLVIDAPKITTAPVVTNDMVRLVSETEFEWLGRYDSVINSGGVKLFPEQIEAKVATLIDSPFIVAGIPDAKLGQQLVLLIEGEVDIEKLLKDIKAFKDLDRFEIPKEIHLLPEFRRTDNGKIRRKETVLSLAK